MGIRWQRPRLEVRRPTVREAAADLALLVLLVLKLTGVITWSWWWVLTPLWIGLVPGVLIGFLIGFGLLVLRLGDSPWWFRSLISRPSVVFWRPPEP